MSNDPSIVLKAVTEMRANWLLVDALMGGTDAMRSAGRAVTEQFPEEDDEAYRARVNRTVLLPAYSETIQANTSRVFADPLQLMDDVPKVIADLCDDIDDDGNDINTWSVEWFGEALAKGLCHVTVDHPKTDGMVSGYDLIASGARPYAVIIKPERVIGWRRKAGQLTQVRYTECVEEPDGEFGVKYVEEIRVLEPGTWRTYRNAGAGWTPHEEGKTGLSYIPWVTFYTGRTGFMEAKPPLMELAHANKLHWNEQSDQLKSVRFARIRLAALIGVDDEALSKIKISSDCMLSLPTGADIKVVQGSAEAVNVGQESLDKIVDQMRMAGAKLLQRDKQPTKTATQAEEEAAQELSPLARMAHQFADALAQLLQIFADYKDIPEGGHVEMRGNFDADFIPEVALPQLLAMANAGMLSKETLFAEMQRRGVISDEYEWADELERIEAQGPSLGGIGADG
ncbi:hypothetical protein D9M71_33920 [compost metagenome]